MFETWRLPETFSGVVLTMRHSQTLPDNTRPTTTSSRRIQSLMLDISQLNPQVLLLPGTVINYPPCNPAGQKPSSALFSVCGQSIKSYLLLSRKDDKIMLFLHRPKLTLAQGTQTSRTQAQDKASAGYESTPSNLQPKSQARSASAIPLEQNLRNPSHPGTQGQGAGSLPAATAWSSSNHPPLLSHKCSLHPRFVCPCTALSFWRYQ